MLHVIKYEKSYICGTDGTAYAVLAFNTKDETLECFVQWGGYVSHGRYEESSYAKITFASFKEAKQHLESWANSAQRKY